MFYAPDKGFSQKHATIKYLAILSKNPFDIYAKTKYILKVQVIVQFFLYK